MASPLLVRYQVLPENSIDDLPLDKRYVNALKRWAKVETVGDLTELCDLEVLSTIKIGTVGCEAVKRALAECGYALRKTTVLDKYRLHEPVPMVRVEDIEFPERLHTYLERRKVYTLPRLAALPIEDLEHVLSRNECTVFEIRLRPYRRQMALPVERKGVGCR